MPMLEMDVYLEDISILSGYYYQVSQTPVNNSLNSATVATFLSYSSVLNIDCTQTFLPMFYKLTDKTIFNN